MKRLAAVAILLLIVGIACGGAVRALLAAGPVYTVPQLDAGLRRQPSAWVGRVIQVRGVVGFCPVRIGCPPNMPPILSAQLGVPSLDPPLQLAFGPIDSPLAILRDVPMLGTLLRQPGRLLDGYQGIVRVRIEPVPLYACYERLCYQGVLTDLAPP